ncbi:SMC family ATPase [Streptomyces sp. WMMC500]|uniref:AAA family ATPase n=1 Tax=Streptomyces sp. WMMC500 TaxID=3015154 RepID=UPI00248C0F99|nr:SMC family ATPase [Streptomyces sp. WMMC500]WBB60863.1 SMC family ATPase [Streptomyces sp. WMMC500]
MRLHRLTVAAFGPFAGAQEVDFDALSGAGIFLLQGATGAGKTSVLDAVCYALYGGVPGVRQGGALRSHHAEQLTPTEVALDFTIAGRRLEVTRRPAQPRPKRNGTGVTTERATSLLRERDPAAGEWRGLSRSHQEIGEEIGRLLGMTREQFCQVVLLPQGDFARFLRADAEARAKLLGRLFDTGRFAAVEDHLAELRRRSQEAVRDGDEQLLHLAHRIRQAGGQAAAGDPDGWSPDAAKPGEADLADGVLAYAAVARATARELADAADLRLRTAEAAHAAADGHLQDVRELARLQRLYADARQRQQALAERQRERAALGEKLRRAREAAAVAPALELRDRTAAAARRAAAAEEAARAALPGTVAGGGPEQLDVHEARARQELGALDAARAAEARGAEITRELAVLDEESRADEDVLRDAAGWLDDWDALRGDLQRRVDEAQGAATRAERLAAEHEGTRRRLDAADRRDELARRTDEARRAHLDAGESAGAAHETWLRLKERRLDGMAAELAARLADGEPCPVCGSAAHPAPATADGAHVGEREENEALAAYRAAERVREEAALRLDSLRQARDAAAEAAGEEGRDTLAAAVERVAGELGRARELAAGALAVREQLDRAHEEHARRVRGRQQAESRAAARASRADALTAERAARDAEVRAARGGAAGVEERAAQLTSLAARLAAASRAAREAAAAAERSKDADSRVADAAYRARFETPEEAAAALLDPAALGDLEARLEAWQAEEAAVAEALAEPRAAAAAARPAAAVDEAEEAFAAAARGLRTAATARDSARERCDALAGLSAEAADRVRRLAPLRTEHHRVSRLATLAAGTSAENERKMRLESYVLAARLEQVAAAATARLARMSSGRFTLVHSDERANGRGRHGLGLHVVDAWTGTERDTATLSGGESFFASLALALGLSDVVAEEAGGVRLDTLFIDEGFGSLDDQTLDEVLDVLDALRERDRTVGIVSHVPELRRRIPAQLEVVKGRSGSYVRHRTAADR